MIAYRDFKSAAECAGVVFRDAEGGKKKQNLTKNLRKKRNPGVYSSTAGCRKKCSAALVVHFKHSGRKNVAELHLWLPAKKQL